MEAETADIYCVAAKVLEAQEMLRAMRVADFPEMKKTPRQKLHKELYAIGYPEDMEDKQPMTMERLAEILGGR